MEDKNKKLEQQQSRSDYVSARWEQLYELQKDAGDDAIKYLFTVNSGGAIGTLAYIGAISKNTEVIPQLVKFSILSFFIGIILVGIHKAYSAHYNESLFSKYQKLTADYHNSKISYEQLCSFDDENVGDSIIPYAIAYASFGMFILGCFLGAQGVF